jgi:hypothetical protein
MKKHITSLRICKIKVNPELQIRVKLNEAIINSYAQAMKEGVKFEPIKVVFGSDTFPRKQKYWEYVLADGFHRYHAALKNDAKTISAEIIKGGNSRALQIALESNRAHGLQMTNEDKHRAVELAVKEWPTTSNNVIAEIVGVSHTFVNKIRPQVETVSTSTRTGKDGKSYPATKIKAPVHPGTTPTAAPATPAPADPKKAMAPKRPASQPASGSKPVYKGPLDKTGLEVPAETIELWNKGVAPDAEAKRFISIAREVKHGLERAQSESNPLFREIDYTGDIATLNQVIVDLKCALPFAVCWSCNGKRPGDCKTCKGRGWVSGFFWRRCCPEEIKKLRGFVDETEANDE